MNRRDLIRLAALGSAGSMLSKPLRAAEANAPAAATARSYSAFNELEIGTIRPRGWLLKQLQKQARGVTSHLHRLYPPFTGNAWLADEPDSNDSWWPWEVRGYWCDGTLRCGLLLDDKQLIGDTSRLIEYTFAHPAADGYLGPSQWREARDANRWPHAVFFRAAMAWHAATGDRSIVTGLQRHYLESKFNYIADRATTNVEAMLWTYERTGDERLLRLAEDSWARSQKFLAMSPGSYGLTERSWLEPGPCGEVHGVTYAELSKIPALLYRWTGERRYLDAAIGAQRKIFEHHLLVGGIPSTSEVLSTTTSRDAHEVCNAIDFPWTWGYLLMATGDAMYADRIERATFNALPGSIKKDWKALQYYSSPNQFLCTARSGHVALMKGTPFATIKQWRYMQRMSYRPSPGHTVVCCPGNLSRGLPNYISRMWMADLKGRGLAATLYGPCSVQYRVGVGNVAVQIETDTTYPYADEIELRLTSERAVEFPLHLRIPGWCGAPELRINGRTLAAEPKNGFVTVRRRWSSGDSVRLKFPMTIETSKWPEDGIAIERGPLVYAHAIDEQWSEVADERASTEFPAWDVTPRSAWNHALLPETETRKPRFEQRAASDEPWMNPPGSIAVAVREVRDWTLLETNVNEQPATLTPPLPDPALLANQVAGPDKELKLVPYASTQLRVAVFPKLKTE